MNPPEWRGEAENTGTRQAIRVAHIFSYWKNRIRAAQAFAEKVGNVDISRF